MNRQHVRIPSVVTVQSITCVSAWCGFAGEEGV